MITNTHIDDRSIGYMRVSTGDQDFALQRDALVKAGVHPDRIFSDVMTGSKMDRTGLKRAIKVLWPGETLVVWKLDRLGRNTIGVLQQVAELDKAGIRIISLTESLDTQSSIGKFVMTIIAAFAQMERDMIAERTKAGIAAYVDRGGKMGQPHPILDRPWRLAKFNELVGSGAVRTDKTVEGGLPDSQIVALLNAVKPPKGTKAIKDMSEQSYRNWKAKGFKGYEIPDLDNIIEANRSEDDE